MAWPRVVRLPCGKNRIALGKLCEIVINPDSHEIYGRDFSTVPNFFAPFTSDVHTGQLELHSAAVSKSTGFANDVKCISIVHLHREHHVNNGKINQCIK